MVNGIGRHPRHRRLWWGSQAAKSPLHLSSVSITRRTWCMVSSDPVRPDYGVDEVPM
ncbi:hypothetical protein CC85DRAFT_287909 [Cutaneotrichosporon oleaginosum]|uniref:Uncharacterized protein n=1 Tax=Cutaneotrichosporon oleaginosum TaxID=879819 RepID=A0A0J0XG44_9TREE|nr:uncharacterized protein CC85DRAFT_287909 [Cutaneotrichosporon oleaginosum]KLT40032.1 hypothetical protein CC85DRAFT_287909 [Cutaneotrichosporon oleaginosum]TXT13826.1 hypothetical protein COLE_00019 [Cutaneotrichosporon oleaginosum]